MKGGYKSQYSDAADCALETVAFGPFIMTNRSLMFVKLANLD